MFRSYLWPLLALIVFALLCGFAGCPSARETADAAAKGAAVAAPFGPWGALVSAILTIVAVTAGSIAKVNGGRLRSEEASHALTKQQLQQYTSAKTMRHEETTQYAPSESEIRRKVQNGQQDVSLGG